MQTSRNRRRSLRSSSDRRPGSRLQRLVGVEALDGLLEAVAADEPHGVVGPAVGVGAQAVDRDDPRVLQPAGDLGLEQEPLAADRVVGVVVEDLLQRHLAVQLRVEGHEDGAQAAPGVGPEDAEPLAVGGGRADGVAGGAVGVVVGAGSSRSRRWASVAVDVGVADPGQALAGRAAGGDGGQALLGVAAVLLEVQGDQGLDARRAASASRSPRATRWSASGRALSRVQAWKAATSWPWSIRPFCRASRPKSRSRSAAMAAMGRASREAGAGGGRSAPDVGGLRPGRAGSVGLSHDGSAQAAPPRPIGPPARSTAPWLRLRAGAVSWAAVRERLIPGFVSRYASAVFHAEAHSAGRQANSG